MRDLPLSLVARTGRNTIPGSGRAAPKVASWLGLAAAPTFAIMALLTALDDDQRDTFCAAMQHASPLGGMTLMYLLMTAFHSVPWIRLVSGR